MLMHKPLKRFYNYLAEIIDRKVNKMDAKNKKREAEWAELFPDGLSSDVDIENLEIKNPCRFL